MKFARLGPLGHERPVVVTDDAVLDLSPVTADIDGAFLAAGGLETARAAVERGELSAIESDGLRVGAPIARPGAVVCVGMNYAAHAAESGAAPPEQPVVFLKPSNTVVGPDDDVTLPRHSTKTDWEVELGLVIGRRTAYLDDPAQARACIAGYVLVDDLSERTFQLEMPGGQWTKGKSAEGFTPTGPWLVTPDEIDAHDVRLRSWVDGQPRQDSTTADLIFDVETVVHDISQYMTLEPGDLVLTGTPEGVALSGRFPYLRDGDVVEIEIDGLGRQRTLLHGWKEGQR